MWGELIDDEHPLKTIRRCSSSTDEIYTCPRKELDKLISLGSRMSCHFGRTPRLPSLTNIQVSLRPQVSEGSC